ncbi:MAG: hypothetical protein BroJett026_11590 [Betaproteobacteria bacterium]|nr:MAG: hypothetical protein BroJett026_11590 [Betaproteobacteria bacterium]
MQPQHARNDAARLRATNVRTALVLLTIALVFFGGVIAARFMGGWTTGISVVGFAVFVFLAFAIGRNLRSPK